MHTTPRARAAGLRRGIALLVWLVAVLLPVALVGLLAVSPTPAEDAWALYAYSFVVITWVLVGAFVVTRRPRHRVGWLLLGTGLILGVSLSGQGYALLSEQSFGGTLPLTTAGWWVSLLFNPALGLALAGLPLCFPDGRLPSRRWRVLAVVAAAALAVTTLAVVVKPGDLETFAGIPNPTAIAGLEDIAAAGLEIGNLVFLGCLPFCLAAPFVRYRRGTSIERQQLKWFGSVAGLALIGIIAATVLPSPAGVIAFGVTTIAIGLVPIAIGMAILRYRLYDIDRIVGRTVAYAIVTAALAAAFIATNLGLQAVLADAAGNSTLTTALSTLVVAVLFQPLRRRVQHAVDRRFNRRRANGERVVAALAAQARDQVDLDRLRAAIIGAVDESMAPAGAGVWLRGQG